ncbi:hypothetical protein AOQ72_21070 [Bradyrhizobium yuanmingense]|uniref:Uncharacterized protein n=1 Tax=Bradyrhizobium yuanmingense TaxID=108015 RepID=A0A0R3C7V7_9BRAD|nr:hypothetical protein AOQ72_21070 [Bradyrhizobium yuanmingense]
MMTSIDDTLSEIRWLRSEIWRCRRILKSGPSGAERKIIQKRLTEQLAAFEYRLATAFPLALSAKMYSPKSTTIRRTDSPEAPTPSAMPSSDPFGRSMGG